MIRDRRLLTQIEALAVHAVLVSLAGTRDDEEHRNDFVRAATRDEQVEYRFQGRLGFGGKFHWDGHEARVGFYREDATALREAIVDCANARLARLFGSPRPASDPYRLLAASAAAMRETSEALAALEAVLLARRSPDRTERPAAGILKAAEARVRASRDALDAAALRAREAVSVPTDKGA